MRCFSIRTLMTIIVLSAIGLAALRNANDWWAGVMLLLALVAFGTATLGAIFLQGRDRAWWTGIALFCGGYLALTLVQGTSTEIAPRLLTSQLLNFVHSQTMASDRNVYRTSLIKYQTTRRQLLNTEQGSKDPNDPLLVAARVKLKNAFKDIRTTASSFKSNLVTATSAFDTNMSLAPGVRWRSLLPGAANAEEFARVGHAFSALLAGLIGGVIAAWFYASREQAEAAAVETHA